MKVGILGSGDVAKALAAGFLAHRHEVMLGTRTPAKLAEWRIDNPVGRIGGFAETAAFGEVVVLAVKGSASLEALRQAGVAALSGKTVIDTTNPIADSPPVDGVLPFFTGPNESLLERLQAEFAMARFVKAFSCVGSAFMVAPAFEGGPPTMFICGDDVAAKTTVTAILAEFGWEVADMGAAAGARAIEPLCQLWCLPGFLRNEWAHAFKLLR